MNESDRPEYDSLERFRDYLLMVARATIGVSYRGKIDAEELVNQSLFEAFQELETFRGMSDGETDRLAATDSDGQRQRRDSLPAPRQRNIDKEQRLAVADWDQSCSNFFGLTCGMTSPSIKAVKHEQELALAGALATLPEQQRSAVELRHLLGCSLQETADAMETSVAAVAGTAPPRIEALAGAFTDTVRIPMTDDREEQLDQIIAEFLQAQESGESVNFDELVSAHPEFASDLQEFFDDLGQIDVMPSPLGVPTVTHKPILGKLRYFGDYELLEEIARGGMGIVYKARQESLNRIVAVKRILAGHLASEEDIKRFQTEAESAANLNHPHIVSVFEVGRHEGNSYFSMEFVDRQESLRDCPRPTASGPAGSEICAGDRRGDSVRPPAGDATSGFEAVERVD